MTHPDPPVGPPPTTEVLTPPPRRNRAGLVLAAFAAALVVILAVTVPLAVHQWREVTTDRTLDEVRTYGDLRVEHVEKDVDYDPVPPVGGPHDPAWLDCGAYDEPVRDENVVHSLEHGTVWITYAADAVDGDDVARLERLLPDEGILSPYPGQEAPVVVTVWGRQLALDGADDPRLELFIGAYGDGHTAPEPLASCAGGVDGDGVGSGVDV